MAATQEASADIIPTISALSIRALSFFERAESVRAPVKMQNTGDMTNNPLLTAKVAWFVAMMVPKQRGNVETTIIIDATPASDCRLTLRIISPFPSTVD